MLKQPRHPGARNSVSIIWAIENGAGQQPSADFWLWKEGAARLAEPKIRTRQRT